MKEIHGWNPIGPDRDIGAVPGFPTLRPDRAALHEEHGVRMKTVKRLPRAMLMLSRARFTFLWQRCCGWNQLTSLRGSA